MIINGWESDESMISIEWILQNTDTNKADDINMCLQEYDLYGMN